MTRTLPGAEFLRHARVFVKHDGVQSPDHVVDLAEQFVNQFGVAHAALNFGLIALVGFGDGVAVGAQVGDKIGGEFVSHEAGAQRGLGGLVGGGIRRLVFGFPSTESACVVMADSAGLSGMR